MSSDLPGAGVPDVDDEENGWALVEFIENLTADTFGCGYEDENKGGPSGKLWRIGS